MKLRKDQLEHKKNLQFKGKFKKKKNLNRQSKNTSQSKKNCSNMLSFFGRNSETLLSKKYATKTQSFQDLENLSSFQRFSHKRHSQQNSQLFDHKLKSTHFKSPLEQRKSISCFKKQKLKKNQLKSNKVENNFKMQISISESETTDQTKLKDNFVNPPIQIHHNQKLQVNIQQRKNKFQDQVASLGLLYFQYYESFEENTQKFIQIQRDFQQNQKNFFQLQRNFDSRQNDLKKQYQLFKNWKDCLDNQLNILQNHSNINQLEKIIKIFIESFLRRRVLIRMLGYFQSI